MLTIIATLQSVKRKQEPPVHLQWPYVWSMHRENEGAHNSSWFTGVVADSSGFNDFRILHHKSSNERSRIWARTKSILPNSEMITPEQLCKPWSASRKAKRRAHRGRTTALCFSIALPTFHRKMGGVNEPHWLSIFMKEVSFVCQFFSSDIAIQIQLLDFQLSQITCLTSSTAWCKLLNLSSHQASVTIFKHRSYSKKGGFRGPTLLFPRFRWRCRTLKD